MHLRVTETAEASLAEAVAEASNKATVVVLRYMAWQRYHFHWAKHNGSGEFIQYANDNTNWIFESSDQKVASVDKDGTVTALSAGKTVISASYNGITLKSTLEVTVS